MRFGFILEGSGVEAIKQFNDNLNNPAKLVSSRMFVGEIRNIKYDFYICKIDYLFPMPTIIFILTLLSGIIFGILWLTILSLFFLAIIFFFSSKYFYFVVMYWGIRRTGFKGKIKLLSTEDTIDKLLG